MTPAATLGRLRDAGVVAVLRAATADGAVRAVEALAAGGVRAVEITFSTPEAPAVIAELRARHGDGLVLGAGTVLEPEQAEAAAAAGAAFLVSPGLDDDVAPAMVATGAATLLGALTPTEVLRARRLGAHAVKIFPGSLAGPGYLRALRGPFPDLMLMPTGGVCAANVPEWLAAGAFAVGAGGELASAAAIAAERWAEITAGARAFTDALAAARAA